MKRSLGRLSLLLIVLTTIGCDHATKYAARVSLQGEPNRSYFGNMVRIGYAENTGGFLSLGADMPATHRRVLFTAVTGLVLAGLAVLVFRGRLDRATGLGMALFVAGGVSNWIDRVLRGSVVDFLNLGIGPLRTGIFNVADVAIMLGAAIMVFGELAKSRRMARSSTA
jgi:signal peptidase II